MSKRRPAQESKATGSNRLGRYLVTGRLGKGGMGVVYQAEDTLLKRQVAIKLLPREVSADPEALKRFLREAQAAAKLNHPNVVAVFDIGETDGTYFIVMELAHGGSAQDFLRTHGPFPWLEATRIVRDACLGAAAAHKAGLIHRDIKPGNILRSKDGTVKLGDFGLVKPAGRKGTEVTALGSIVGTPHYMSPEQSQSSRVDERSDLYSLGATYYALLTGCPPYLADDPVQVLFAHCALPIPDPRKIVPEIPGECAALIRKAMAKNRGQRYANAGEFSADLERLLGSQTGENRTTILDSQSAPLAWGKESSAENTHALSLLEAYPGERTERLHVRGWHRWKALAFISLLVAILGLSFLMLGRSAPGPEPKVATLAPKSDDWPGLVAAANKAVRRRDAKAMKAVLDKIQETEARWGEKPDQRNAMRQTQSRLKKSLAFRELITEKGFVLGMEGWVTSVAFSPDDKWLAIGQGNGGGGVLIWDSFTGEKQYSLWFRRFPQIVSVQALAIADDSQVVAAACADGEGVKLRNLGTGKEWTLTPGSGVNKPLALAFVPGSRHLMTGMEPFLAGRGRPYLKMWNIDTGLEVFPFKAEHTAKVNAVAFTPRGQQVASGSADQRVVFWNAETGRIWRELRTGIVIQAIGCSPDGRTFAVAGMGPGGPVLQFWDYVGSNLLTSQPTVHGPCRCVAFSARGHVLASGSGPNVLLWNAETHQLLATLKGHSVEVTSLAFSSEGGILASGGNDQSVRLWDVTRFLPRPIDP